MIESCKTYFLPQKHRISAKQHDTTSSSYFPPLETFAQNTIAESQQHHGQHGHVEFQAGDPSMISGRWQPGQGKQTEAILNIE